MKPTLYIMCGIPGSGKDWCLENVNFTNENFLVVSRDAIRFAMIEDGDEYFSTEPQVFGNFVNHIVMLLESNYNAVANATHISKVSRAKLLRAIRKRTKVDFNVVCVEVSTSLETCLRQNSRREGRECVPVNVIRNMCERYEDVEFEEDAAIKKIITINTADNSVIVRRRDD